jgi:hypothetical protein
MKSLGERKGVSEARGMIGLMRMRESQIVFILIGGGAIVAGKSGG